MREISRLWSWMAAICVATLGAGACKERACERLIDRACAAITAIGHVGAIANEAKCRALKENWRALPPDVRRSYVDRCDARASGALGTADAYSVLVELATVTMTKLPSGAAEKRSQEARKKIEEETQQARADPGCDPPSAADASMGFSCSVRENDPTCGVLRMHNCNSGTLYSDRLVMCHGQMNSCNTIKIKKTGRGG